MQDSSPCRRNPNRSWPGQLALLIVMFLLSPSAVSRAQHETAETEVDAESRLCFDLSMSLHVGKAQEQAAAVLLDFKATKEARLRDELSALRTAIANNSLDPSVFEAAYLDTRSLAICSSVLRGRGDEIRGVLSQGLDSISLPELRDALRVQLSELLARNNGELEEELERAKLERARALKVYAEHNCDENLRAQGIPDGRADETSSDCSDGWTNDGGTGTQSDAGLGGATGETSNDDFAETVVDNLLTKEPADCTLAGTWRRSTVNVGATTWEITASGQAKETGIGYAKGTATLSGRTLRIDWTTTNGYAGTYQWTLDSDCKSGTGSLVFSAGGAGSFDSIVTR